MTHQPEFGFYCLFGASSVFTRALYETRLPAVLLKALQVSMATSAGQRQVWHQRPLPLYVSRWAVSQTKVPIKCFKEVSVTSGCSDHLMFFSLWHKVWSVFKSLIQLIGCFHMWSSSLILSALSWMSHDLQQSIDSFRSWSEKRPRLFKPILKLEAGDVLVFFKLLIQPNLVLVWSHDLVYCRTTAVCFEPNV